MRIRLLVDKTGARWDGQDWPPRYGEIDVPGDEAAALITQGDAVPVTDSDTPAETPEDALTAATETRAKPIVNSPKAAWVDHAVSQGFDRAVAESMTKADLIGRFGHDQSAPAS